ncbi:MAG: hypothetical protein S4CHLAM102_02960 [Chlamydiia bacterium]|nr:hypothetical protein [Chlamydiia bacterium]
MQAIGHPVVQGTQVVELSPVEYEEQIQEHLRTIFNVRTLACVGDVDEAERLFLTLPETDFDMRYSNQKIAARVGLCWAYLVNGRYEDAEWWERSIPRTADGGKVDELIISLRKTLIESMEYQRNRQAQIRFLSAIPTDDRRVRKTVFKPCLKLIANRDRHDPFAKLKVITEVGSQQAQCGWIEEAVRRKKSISRFNTDPDVQRFRDRLRLEIAQAFLDQGEPALAIREFQKLRALTDHSELNQLRLHVWRQILAYFS